VPEKYFEVRWHGRAGQGAKSASQFLAEAALDAGKFSTSFPEYGAERSGAPMKAFNRISDVPVRVRSNVQTPDVTVVIDDTLLGNPDITLGMKEDSVLIVNTVKSLEKVREITGFKGKLAVIAATDIAMEQIHKNIPNTVMVGTIVRVTNIVPLDIVKTKVEDAFTGKFSNDLVEANLKAVERGFEEVTIDG
jgi:pyruvate ferredoxin oxidoreductase gamma subunit